MVTINFSKRQWSENLNSVGFTRAGSVYQAYRAGSSTSAGSGRLTRRAGPAASRSAGPGRLRSLLVALSVGLHGERVAELAVAGWTHRTRPAHHSTLPYTRRKIRLVESNAKCRYLKKLTCKGTSRQVFNLSEAPSPPIPPYSPPSTHCIRVYKFTRGRWGVPNKKKDYRGNISQSRSKISTWLTVSPVYKLY